MIPVPLFVIILVLGVITTVMPFGKYLEDVVNKGQARLKEKFLIGQQPSRPSSSWNNPPPIPTYSKPGSNGSGTYMTPYFQPKLDPSVPVSQNFRYELGSHGWGNNELQNYVDLPANSFHTPSGKLVIRAIANSGAPDGQKYTSARLTSHQTLSRNRGSLTVRLTAPCASGVWPAFWLLPADPFSWPTDGEVDIFESWNGDRINHSCLHWGHFNGEDYWKHRVRENSIPDMDRPDGHVFNFVWDQPDNGHGGRLIWFIDGQPAMRAEIPAGTRRLADFRIIANVALGGNVCNGLIPRDGSYDLVVHDLKFDEQPVGGWEGFNRAWAAAQDGHTM